MRSETVTDTTVAETRAARVAHSQNSPLVRRDTNAQESQLCAPLGYFDDETIRVGPIEPFGPKVNRYRRNNPSPM
jgi:hypothetical protein